MEESDATNLDDLQQSLLFKQEQDKADDSDAHKPGNLRSLSADTFENLYFEQGKTLQQIADLFGVSSAGVFKWVRRNMPPSVRLRRVSKKSMYKINEAFFDSWTPEMAYVLGVLATDGNVGQYHVSLNSTDLELVEKVRSLIGSNHDIKEIPIRGWSRKPQYQLSVSSLKFVTALREFGVTARKSLTLAFPQMPEECVRHFLRGCWDGDGSFYFESKTQKFRASFVSGSREFVNGMVVCLTKAGVPRRREWMWRGSEYAKDFRPLRIHELHRGENPSYYLTFGGEAAIWLGKFMYDSVPESMYLTRKHDIYLRAVKGASTGNRA